MFKFFLCCSAKNDPADCWAEFSIDSAASAEISKVADVLCGESKEQQADVKISPPPSRGHHVTLLYGYRKSESNKLMEIVKKHFDKPLILTAGEIIVGDVSPVILLRLKLPQELEELFWDSYKNVGQKKHTLIDGKYFPHITVATYDKKDMGKINLEHVKDSLQGRQFTIDTIFSYREDKDGNNILLDQYSHAVNAAKLTAKL